MSHTLHRQGMAENLTNDYIVFAMSAKGINEKGSAVKLRRFLQMAMEHSPINFGDMKTGNRFTHSLEEIMDGIQDVSIVHAVFTDLDPVVALLRELKEDDLGVSVVVTGLVEPVAESCQRAGLQPHTVEYSLGIWGQTGLLPEPWVLEISTMCGHGQVAFDLVRRLVRQVERGRMTAAEAVMELARPCVCGVFNTERARLLIERMCAQPATGESRGG
ncbi:MAG: hypothetical protein M1136_07680 [Chloroflexi bacterium]|nr:hypothetical protein [Chloroflexota bacterium]